ncbi:TadA family conjugal transfer-associated ATPase [Janibacter sp. G56]|uniref:TadA family conjugal transfer-associated ATPase n=1 Tax=Janibacter sp. G56 TaxID=3418717 RepID=UPI003D0747D3
MSWSTEIDRRIRDGQVPTGDVLSDVVAAGAERLGDVGAQREADRLRRELMGLGPLEAVATKEGVTDVLVNGDGSVWLDDGRGLTREPAADLGSDGVRRLAVRLAAHAGRRLDDSRPWVDGLLPGGIRLHAILPPLVDGGAHISLRVPRRMATSLDDLVALGMLTSTQVAQVRDVVVERRAFVVSGGTGTGKTTLLAAALAEVAPTERVVLVEDVREMALDHPHVVRLQSRPPNVEGAGTVTMVDLVRQALRMRPDRLVVGEVRGAEVRELLLALNTGHEGGAGTIHANRAEDVAVRFEALGALAGMSPDAVRSQLATAIEVVVHLRRDASGTRRVEAIRELGR